MVGVGRIALTVMVVAGVAAHAARSIESDTGLLGAAWRGDYYQVEQLLEDGRDPNRVYRPNNGPRTALVAASMRGNEGVVRRLLAWGAKVDKAHPRDPMPLAAAAGGNHVQVVRLLLTHGAPVNRRTRNVGTALQLAATEGHAEVAQMLLEQGADPTYAERRDVEPLYLAVRGGHLTVAQLLTAHGAEAHRSYGAEGSLIGMALRAGRTDLADHLETVVFTSRKGHEPHADMLTAAVIIGEVDRVVRYISYDAALNGRYRGGDPPLVAAVKANSLEIARALLEAGAKPDQRGTAEPNFGESNRAHDIARYVGNAEMIALFERHLASAATD